MAAANGYDDSAPSTPTSASKKPKSYRRSDSTASGGSRSRSTTKELVLPPDDALMCPPSFASGLKPEQDVRDGSHLELRVQVRGDPDPQVVWTKNGKPLVSGEILEVKYKNGVATLTINEVFPEDAGKYACKATNAKGAIETTSVVRVVAGAKDKPSSKPVSNGSVNGSAASASSSKAAAGLRIFSHVKSAVVRDGEPVRLECTVAAGDAKYEVMWLHEEKEIKPGKDFAYKTVGNTHVLEIAEIFPEDAGTYTCEAFSDAGECFSTCTVSVEVPGDETQRPVFKTFPVSLTAERSKNASFVAELDQVVKEVIWMKDGKVLKDAPTKVKMTAAKTRLTLDVLNCSQTDSGQYAVIVVGEKGEAKAAFSLNVNN